MVNSTWSREHFSTVVLPTNGEWYSRLARGVKFRTGVVQFHDKALTLQMVLVALIYCLGVDYE